MTLELNSGKGGVLFKVRVAPGSRRNAVRGLYDGGLKVAVTAAPEKGKANKAVIRLLAATLQVSRASVQIISGETASAKTVLVLGLSQDEVRQRILQALQLP